MINIVLLSGLFNSIHTDTSYLDGIASSKKPRVNTAAKIVPLSTTKREKSVIKLQVEQGKYLLRSAPCVSGRCLPCTRSVFDGPSIFFDSIRLSACGRT